ncbi:MAG: tripartite tricarboxylate transporter substrate binding protein [Verrucomicrobiaceae bacterium]
MKAIFRSICVLVAAAVVSFPATAQQWQPEKPIRLIVPFAPGASTDILIRLVSERLSTVLGQPLVFDNRAGAGGTIGTAAALQYPPDGYTWVAGADSAITILPQLQKVPYDALKNFKAISLIADYPLTLVVNPALPVKTMEDLVALAKQRPITVGTNGIGSSAQLATEQFKKAAGIDITHVPYKALTQALSDVMSGQVDFAFSSVPPIKDLVKTGRLRAIATTSPQRVAALPDVPTTKEAGYPTVDVDAWSGILALEGTPPEVIDRVNREVTKILTAPDVRERLIGMELVPIGGSAESFTRRIKRDYEKWGKLIKEANIKAE